MEKNRVCWEGGHDELRAGYDDLEVLLLQVGIFSRHISVGSTMLVYNHNHSQLLFSFFNSHDRINQEHSLFQSYRQR